MNPVAEHFASLTAQFEDMHGLAVEGQVADQPREVCAALTVSLAKGLRQAQQLVSVIRTAVDGAAHAG